MNSALLLVTWFLAGHNLSSYQVQFSSMEACQNARIGLVAENQRLRTESEVRPGPGQIPGAARPSEPPPFVSAVCAKL